MSQLEIGTSGWGYEHWMDCFYQGEPRKNWLRFYADNFSSVEINASFYRLQTTDTFHNWYSQTPENFRFALKANRFLTHYKKLLDPLNSILIEKDHAKVLGKKLSAVLWQLPGSFKKNSARLKTFIEALRQWPEVPHAIEFRHPTWFDDETESCLVHEGIAVCQSDSADWPSWDAVTSELIYIRLHGHDSTYASFYSDNELSVWSHRIQQWLLEGRDVSVYFDNDAHCAAPKNAMLLQHLMKQYRTFL